MERNIIWDLALLSVGLLTFIGFILAKEYIKAKRWIILTFGFPALVFIIIFFSKNIGENLTINSFLKDNWPYVGFFIFLILLFYMPIYLFMALKNYFYRPLQMKKIAQKYNLNYSNPKRSFWKFEISSSSEIKKNIIEGKINGKNIEIYDFIDIEGYPIGISSISRRATIVSVDGVKNEIRSFITGLGPIKKIDSFLSKL